MVKLNPPCRVEKLKGFLQTCNQTDGSLPCDLPDYAGRGRGSPSDIIEKVYSFKPIFILRL